MLHGRHDRKSNAVADNATAAILCDREEFGKTIGAAGSHQNRPEPIAFSSEVDTGSREENASKQESGASVLIQSEPKL
jgi:hypothetical protein